MFGKAAATTLVAMLGIATALPATASPFYFSTGNPDGQMAAASRPASGGKLEIETADDFLLTTSTSITSATFTGLIPTGSSVQNVEIEIYRVFPNDSDVVRIPQVPTRINSPSDVAFETRVGAQLTFSTQVLASSFTALNSVQPNGIHPLPGSTTGGNGPVSGQEVMFSVDFLSALNLSADHYFFVPQVQLDSGDFYWLSAPLPIVPPGTELIPDLQSWTRDEGLDPDWLRVGKDIVSGTSSTGFNQAFSLTGITADAPEPTSLALIAGGLGGLPLLRRRRSGRILR